jgi:hypothetical protein
VDIGSEIFVVSECRPVGCGFDVILLRARHTGLIFAYCDGCGCIWSYPAASRFEQGLNEIIPPHVVARHGVELPSGRDVVETGFEAIVVRAMPVSDSWIASIEQLNVQIVREVTT